MVAQDDDRTFEEIMAGIPDPPPAEPKAKKGKRKPANFGATVQRDFERAGYHIGLVEQRVAHTRYNKEEQRPELYGTSKRDLFGFGDYLAFKRDGYGAILLQVCTKAAMATRLRSACTFDAGEVQEKRPVLNVNRGSVLIDWLLAGNQFWIVGYEKQKGRWVPTVIKVTLPIIRYVTESTKRIQIAQFAEGFPS